MQESMFERMRNGEPYQASDSKIQQAQAVAAGFMERFNNSAAEDHDSRIKLLQDHLGAFGEGSHIRPPFYVDYGSNIFIGTKVFANFGLVALDVGDIYIGDHVQIGPNVQLLTPTHPLDAEERKAGWEAQKAIRIEANVWLGGGCIVLPGVTIGENSVIGAGAVVTKDIPPDSLAVGNPAKVVRTL
jgi:maltose O-acetyltransferase